jgi:hypothetical protein
MGKLPTEELAFLEPLKPEQIKRRMILLGLTLLLISSCCCFGTVLAHDYAYRHVYIGRNWSDLSSLKNEKDVSNTLKAHLVLNQTTVAEAAAYLDTEGIKDCDIYDNFMTCLTPAIQKIINPQNPLDIHINSLFCTWSYELRLDFTAGILSQIRVDKFSTCM